MLRAALRGLEIVGRDAVMCMRVSMLGSRLWRGRVGVGGGFRCRFGAGVRAGGGERGEMLRLVLMGALRRARWRRMRRRMVLVRGFENAAAREWETCLWRR